MKGIAFSVAFLATLPGTALAGDKPVIGPAPAWVKPVALPTADKDDGAPIRVLLNDQQVSLQSGKIAAYREFAIKIQTPQGLAAGNISLPWRPDTDELTVHKLRIRRGDKVIDVLGGGQAFTVLRRETNLEMAMLDGVLTANIQPEGLQVGDVLEMATTLTSSDPVLKGHVETGGGWIGASMARAHMRVLWPADLKARIRIAGAMPAATPSTANGVTSVEMAQDNVQPIIPPKGAPDRYALTRLVEVSDFTSWADLGALLAPLYDKAATLKPDSPLLAEIARIKAASPDPAKRAEAALALVQDRLRYVALVMGAGGLVPADADTSWGRRYGDCKAKTALLLALLRGLGFEAQPVIVNALSGDGMDQRLPMIDLFNHVLVRATIAGKSYWLDGTRTGDTSLERLRVPAFEWGLPLVPSGAALVRMQPAPFDQPAEEVSLRIDASAGITLPAPFKAEIVMRGDAAVGTNAALSALTGDTRDSALRKFWRDRYDFVDIKTMSTAFDAKTNEMRLTMDGLATMDWSSGWYETDGTRVGYRADFSRDPGPNADAPYSVAYPYFEKSSETIVLPPGFPDQKAQLGPDVDETVAGIAYHRHATMSGTAVTIEETERSLVAEFPAKDAPAAEKRLRELSGKGVYLKKPDNYARTKAELDKLRFDKPTTAAAFNERGNIELDEGHWDEAISDFGGAIAIDAKNAPALAARGLAYVWKKQYDQAARDLDAAEGIESKNAVAARARALIKEQHGIAREAITAYTRALELDPDNAWALGRRGWLRLQTGDAKGALADAASALEKYPTWTDMRTLRVQALLRDGQRDQLRPEAAAVVAANPGDPELHAVAAGIYTELHDPVAAVAAYDRAIAIKPLARYYVARSQARNASDLAARTKDLDAAIKLDPKFSGAWAAKAEMASDAIDFDGAIRLLGQAIALAPDDILLLIRRASVYQRKGNLAAANKDLDAAIKLNPTSPVPWAAKAEMAAKSVDQTEAIRLLGQAIALAPDNSGFLLRRSFMYRQKGDLAAARRDLDAAVEHDPQNSFARKLRAEIAK